MDNELRHWKYVRKERKNGKWRYYYDDTTKKEYNIVENLMGVDERDRAKLANEEYRRAQARKNLKEQNWQGARTALGEKYIPYIDPYTGGYPTHIQEQLNREAEALVKPAYNKYKVASARAVSAGKKAVSANEAYLKTPLGALSNASSKVKKGAKKVKNFLKKWF